MVFVQNWLWGFLPHKFTSQTSRINPTRAGGSQSTPPPTQLFFGFAATENDTGTKIGDFSENFMGKILTCISVCQLAGSCYGNKV